MSLAGRDQGVLFYEAMNSQLPRNKFFRSNIKLFVNLFIFLAAPFFLVSCIHGPGTFYFGNYSEAENLFNRGQYERAIQKYQAYIDENPEGNLAVISQYYIARSHLALGHKDEAKDIFQHIVQKYPDIVWARFSETQLKELESASVVPVIKTNLTAVSPAK